MLKNIKETITEIIIDNNWYLIYSNYKWQTETNVFKNLSYDFIKKNKIDIRDNREDKIFKILEKKQNHK